LRGISRIHVELELRVPLSRIAIAVSVCVWALLAFGACGTASTATSGPSQNVIPSDRLFAIEDFATTGFKVAKEYDVKGLTAATGAWFGFWRPDGSAAKEYEIRFYASHADAVALGTSFAEEATGEGANLDEETATWKEGIRDRRYFFAGPIGSHGSGAVRAKYGGYAIYGNMILLCEGANRGHSLDRCDSLIDAIVSANG
jgi:hypothetical protein